METTKETPKREELPVAAEFQQTCEVVPVGTNTGYDIVNAHDTSRSYQPSWKVQTFVRDIIHTMWCPRDTLQLWEYARHIGETLL